MSAVVTFGEILVRLSTTKSTPFAHARNLDLFYVGSEANVAVALSSMGNQINLVSTLPDNELGNTAIKEIRSYGVDTRFILRTPGRIGTLFVEKGSGIRKSQVLYDRQNTAFSMIPASQYNWESILTGKRWFHLSGITPGISEKASEAADDAISMAKKQGLTISLDLNYRKSIWEGKNPVEIMPGFVEQVDYLLADPESSNKMLGININIEEFTKPEDSREFFIQVKRRFPNLKQVAMVMRNVHSQEHHEITGLAFDGDKITASKKLSITSIVERIGSGDCFMAGWIHSLINEKNTQYAMDYAVTSCALNMTIAGDFNHFDNKVIEAKVNKGFDTRIER